MARFGIYEKAGDRRVLGEGRSYTAFLFTGFWLLAKGLWLEAVCVAAFIFLVVFPLFLQAPLAAFALSFVPGVYLWLEGHHLVAARFIRRGWSLVALVEANSEDGAAMIYDLEDNGAVAAPPPIPRLNPLASQPRVQGNLRGPSPFGLEGL